MLARDGRVILVDLALAAPKLAVISKDPDAPGIADLVRGTASFAQVINRDQSSSVHLVTAGTLTDDVQEVLESDKLISALDALARTYDQVILDIGPIERAAESVVRLATRAVLVTPQPDDETTAALRAQLLTAGFQRVSLAVPVASTQDDAVQPAAA